MIKIKFINNGFWNYYNDIFQHSNEIYEAKDILFSHNTGKFENFAFRLHQSLKILAMSADKSDFNTSNRYNNIWNLYTIPFNATADASNIQKDLLKSNKIHLAKPSINLPNFKDYIVTEGLLISINFVGQAPEDSRDKLLAPKLLLSFIKPKRQLSLGVELSMYVSFKDNISQIK